MDSTSTTISSNSIARRFEELGARKRRALVGYLTAGFPDVDRSVECLRALEEGGADIIELGVPFSDPIADGPVIQASSQRALAGDDLRAHARDRVAREGARAARSLQLSQSHARRG